MPLLGGLPGAREQTGLALRLALVLMVSALVWKPVLHRSKSDRTGPVRSGLVYHFLTPVRSGPVWATNFSTPDW